MTAQTSEHGGYIRGQLAEMDTGGDAVDAALARACVNNALHLLDEAGQYVVCAVPPTGEYLEQASPSTTRMALIGGADWSIPSLRIRHGDASSFRIVVYMRAYISAAGTATFWITLRPQDRHVLSTPRDPDVFSGMPNVVKVTTTNTTGEDLTATLYLSADQVRRMPLSIWPSEDGGGDAAGCVTYPAALQVWAKSSVGSSLPRIISLTAREYAGDR